MKILDKEKLSIIDGVHYSGTDESFDLLSSFIMKNTTADRVEKREDGTAVVHWKTATIVDNYLTAPGYLVKEETLHYYSNEELFYSRYSIVADPPGSLSSIFEDWCHGDSNRVKDCMFGYYMSILGIVDDDD